TRWASAWSVSLIAAEPVGAVAVALGGVFPDFSAVVVVVCVVDDDCPVLLSALRLSVQPSKVRKAMDARMTVFFIEISFADDFPNVTGLGIVRDPRSASRTPCPAHSCPLPPGS